MTPEPDHDSQRISPSTWTRWRLLWRVHYGVPATLALILWAVSLPLAVTVVDRYKALHEATADHGVGTPTATSGDLRRMGASAAATAASATSTTASSTALAAALAAGDALLTETLPSTSQRGADLGVLISAARNSGLSPSQADYALETGTISGLARLRVDLPVRGSDAQLTRFMTLLDAQLPNAVVESLVLAPAGPRQPQRAIAHLHLVLFYRAPA